MQLLKLIIFSVFILLFSCQNKKTNIPKKEIFNLNRTLTISIPDSVSPELSNLKYINNPNLKEIVCISRSRHILTIDLKAEKITKIVKIPEDGNAQIKGKSFFIHNKDSIFGTIEYPASITLFNSDAKILKQYEIINYSKNNINDEFANTTQWNTPPLFLKGNLFLNLNFGLDPIENKQDFFSKPLQLICNISNPNKSFSLGQYSELYLESGWYPWRNFVTRAVLKNKILFSFPIDHKIYVYNLLNKQLIKQFNCKSNYIDNIKKAKYDNFQENMNYIMSEPAYLNILYNKNTKVYYRIVKHRQENTSTNGKSKQAIQSKWSIIAFDEDFQAIGEQDFEQEKYNFTLICTTSNGFAITNSIFNSNYTENKLKIYLFKQKN